MEESNVQMILGFSKEKGVENLGIEPKLHYDHLFEVWHFFFAKTCCNFGLMMFA
jgi:hypothetical protein